MVGYPGSGKSSLAERLTRELRAKYLSSDAIRARLRHSARYSEKGESKVEEDRQLAHQALYREAVSLIRKGHIVIIDATHLEIEKRSKAITTLSRAVTRDSLCFIVLKTPRAVIRKRMRNSSEYAGWERVIAMFDQRRKQGLITWPSKTEGVDIIRGEDL